MNSPLKPNPDPPIEKGHRNGECNRTACINGPAEFYNSHTQRWYCYSCACKINNFAGDEICYRRNDNG